MYFRLQNKSIKVMSCILIQQRIELLHLFLDLPDTLCVFEQSIGIGHQTSLVDTKGTTLRPYSLNFLL